jgi:hypothetical protein
MPAIMKPDYRQASHPSQSMKLMGDPVASARRVASAGTATGASGSAPTEIPPVRPRFNGVV